MGTVVTISFDSNTFESRGEMPVDSVPAFSPMRLGPDGSALRSDFQFVKPGKGRAFVRARWHLDLQTKVRSDVVAHWMLAQFANVEVALGHEMVNYRHKESALAQLIDVKSAGLGNGVPSDPPEDDDGGDGVTARLKPDPPGLPGSERPPRSGERE
jgi:hypothetical protein